MLYLSISPFSSYTGRAKWESYLYQPNLALRLCFTSLFSRKCFPSTISRSSGIPCVAFAFAFDAVPRNLYVYSDPVYSRPRYYSYYLWKIYIFLY